MAQEDRDRITELIAKMEAQQAAIAELLSRVKASVGRAADNTKDQPMSANRAATKRQAKKRKTGPRIDR